MLFRLWVIVGLLFFGTFAPLSAQSIMLAVEGEGHKAGDTLTLSLVFENTLEGQYHIPDTLQAQLVRDGASRYIDVELTRAQGNALPLEADGFRRTTFTLSLPAVLEAGFYQLMLPGGYMEPVYLRIEPGVSSEEVKASIPTLHRSEEECADNDFLEGLCTYHPVYFLASPNPLDAKFQISLRYQMFNPKGGWAQKHHWLSHLYLGYTQLAFWDLHKESKPFQDINFMPEVFYRFEDLKLGFLPDDGEFSLQTGFLHESNGKGGDDSRSLNILYGRASYYQPLADDWFFRLSGDAWRYVGSLEDNPDIADFRGHSSLGLTVGQDEGFQFVAYRRGKIGGSKGSYLFDLSFPLGVITGTKNVNFTVHSQLFTGYGENLLTYDQKETRFRFGIGLHR